jgi:hypothetical protein
MKLPRGLTGKELIAALGKLGYAATHGKAAAISG